MRAKEKVGEGAAPAAADADVDAAESGLESAMEPSGDADTDAVVDEAAGEIGCCGCGGDEGSAIGSEGGCGSGGEGARATCEAGAACAPIDKAPGSTYVALRRARSLARRYAKTGWSCSTSTCAGGGGAGDTAR
jgi:hypothetical protein